MQHLNCCEAELSVTFGWFETVFEVIGSVASAAERISSKLTISLFMIVHF